MMHVLVCVSMVFTQPLDHFDMNNEISFNQRYTIDSSHAKDDREISLIIDLGIPFHYFDQERSNSVYSIAQIANSKIIKFENRFFGESFPKPYNESNFKYLTIEQMLEDLALFVSYARESFCQTPSCPVLMVGGKFFGTIASWFRLKYPHLANFSWASSSPLKLATDCQLPDNYIETIYKNFHYNCYRNSKNILSYFEFISANTSSVEYLTFRNKLGLEKSTDPISALNMITDFFFGIAETQSQFKLMHQYCEGQHGYSLNLTSFYDVFDMYLSQKHVSADDLDLLLKPTNNDYSSWRWLLCHEIGMFSINSTLRSSFVDTKYFEKVCRTRYNITQLPSSKQSKLQYGSLKPSISMSMFSNGEYDPWSKFGLSKSDPSISMFSYTILGEGQCADFKTPQTSDSLDLRLKRSVITDQLGKWLNNTCLNNCKNGCCIMGECVCHDGYGGGWCIHPVVDRAIYTLFSASLVIVPTIITLISGISAWVLFRKTKEEALIRRMSTK